jgi:hypothetical protein
MDANNSTTKLQQQPQFTETRWNYKLRLRQKPPLLLLHTHLLPKQKNLGLSVSEISDSGLRSCHSSHSRHASPWPVALGPPPKAEPETESGAHNRWVIPATYECIYWWQHAINSAVLMRRRCCPWSEVAERREREETAMAESLENDATNGCENVCSGRQA